MMEWLMGAIAPGSPFARWGVLAACVAAAVVIAALIIFVRGRKKRASARGTPVQPEKRVKQRPRTERPKTEAAPLELANLQGQGRREEQQDAFGVSPLDAYDSRGLLCVLCDGMGGMQSGREIAQSTVSAILEAFPFDEGKLGAWPRALSSLSRDVRARYGGRGGTTLVMTYLCENRLWFFCAGDSDLMLVRNGGVYFVNMRHEYKNMLLSHAIRNDASADAAFDNPQSLSLTSYIGADDVECEMNMEPLILEKGDKLMLCTDGVTDTLSLSTLKRALMLPPREAVLGLEDEITAQGKAAQDNYTAIILQYNRSDAAGNRNAVADNHNA